MGFRQPETVNFVNRLALSLEREGQLTKALPLYRFVLEFYDKTLGDEHQNTAFAVMNLADCLVGLGKHRDALPLRRRQLELFRAQPGHKDTYLEMSLVNLAECLGALGLINEELPLRQELFERRTSRVGDHDEATLDALHNLAICQFRARCPAEALELFQKVVDGWVAREGPPNRKTLEATNAIGVCLMNLGRFTEATSAFAKTVAIAEASGLGDDPLANKAKNLLTESLRHWTGAPAKGTYETDSAEYSNCMQWFTRREFAEFLECAKPMVNKRAHTLAMMQAILISLQRRGEESILRALVPQLFATLKDPWQRSLVCLILGLEESATVQAAAQNTNQSVQAHYYTGCRLLTLGRVEEARREFEMARNQKANNEEWLFSLFELGHSDLSIETANGAARLVDGAMWAQFRPAQKAGDGSKAEVVPFTVSEVMDQLIKDGIPREEWEHVVDELNAHGKAFFTAHEYHGAPLKEGTRLEYSLQRMGLMYMSSVILSDQDASRQQPSKPIPERVFCNADGLPISSPSGLVADDVRAWVSYRNGGLFSIDGKTGVVEALPAKEGHLRDEIVSLHLSRRFLWVGSEMGLSRLDVKQGSWKTYAFDVGSIKAMREDGDSLWALSDSQLVHLDWPHEELRAIPLPVRGDARALATMDGEVWCGFDEERATLFRFGVRDESWSQVSTIPYVLSLLHEPVWHGEGDLWVGTCMGVQLVDRDSGSAKDTGLLHCGMIHSIANVGGLMAFGTTHGLIGIDLISQIIRGGIQIEPLRFTGQRVTEVSGGKEVMWAAVADKGIAYLPLEALRIS